jgi:hypothetical protein
VCHPSNLKRCAKNSSSSICLHNSGSVVLSLEWCLEKGDPFFEQETSYYRTAIIIMDHVDTPGNFLLQNCYYYYGSCRHTRKLPITELLLLLWIMSTHQETSYYRTAIYYGSCRHTIETGADVSPSVCTCRELESRILHYVVVKIARLPNIWR